MGGDDSQKLLPWRGTYSPPGRSKPPDISQEHFIQECSPLRCLTDARVAGLVGSVPDFLMRLPHRTPTAIP
jgi:hypothetical protein